MLPPAVRTQQINATKILIPRTLPPTGHCFPGLHSYMIYMTYRAFEVTTDDGELELGVA